MMNGLLLICLSLVAESWAVPKVMPMPSHPSQDLIMAATETNQMSHSRIIGGDSASISQYPWQVSLRSYNQHICGGVILDATTVLTAAHCVGNNANTYSVKYGSGYRTSGGTVSSVTSVTQHSDYNKGNGAYPNDIAILKVNQMNFDNNAQPISLTERSNDDLAEGASCVITGWGYTNGNTGTTPTELQQAAMVVLTDDVCRSTWGSNLRDECHVCVYGEGERSACNGDSGGPLVCWNGNQYELVGVTSWGANGCPANYPSVYTEVKTYASWIQSYM